ncbi:MAG: protein tyrosine phosphatase [Sulfitobacter sp.]|nr:protein tyrosine phosphatase [Sulfitobacter sp.]
MSPPVYRVAADLPGSLWIMPHPPADDLPGAISAYATEGIEHIISLLEAEEARALGLSREEMLCSARGITFQSHPIPDFALPQEPAFGALIWSLSNALSAGEAIAVHCRAGVGRSGMVAACTLIARGLSGETALQRVSEARGVSVPDTVAQRDFVLNFSPHPN